jgi:RNA polymerase-binding transcription factor DksA
MSDQSAPETPTVTTFDRARDLPRLEQVARDLSAVEAALERLDNDTYGCCTICGAAIDDTRLAESPAAEDCGAHSY